MDHVSNASDASRREIITFRIGSEEFGVDVMSVREIRVWTPATPLAHAPSYVCGVINLRGMLLPIIDFAAVLGYPRIQPNSRNAILVVQIDDQVIGLLVEGVSEILTISQDLVQPPPDTGSTKTKRFITGVFALEGRLISLVSLDGLLPSARNQIAA